jgi:kumamolisin
MATKKLTGRRRTRTCHNQLKSETGWKLGGGGISGFYKLPDWQTSVLTAPYNMRSYPDVAFNADNKSGEAIWTHYGSFLPHWLVIGGTSMASPQWAGLVTLINEARVAGGKGEAGFLNPMLYQGAQSTAYANLFHDITSGNNGYPAKKGWDAVTGWGSPKADGVLAYILAQ